MVRQPGFAESRAEILLVQHPRTLDLALQGFDQHRGSMVRLSLPPLPSRTVISALPKSMSLTRRRRHSIRRMPVP